MSNWLYGNFFMLLRLVTKHNHDMQLLSRVLWQQSFDPKLYHQCRNRNTYNANILMKHSSCVHALKWILRKMFFYVHFKLYSVFTAVSYTVSINKVTFIFSMFSINHSDFHAFLKCHANLLGFPWRNALCVSMKLVYLL